MNDFLARFPFEMEKTKEEESDRGGREEDEESFAHLLRSFPESSDSVTELSVGENDFASSTPKTQSKVWQQGKGEKRKRPQQGEEVEGLKKEIAEWKEAYNKVVRSKPCTISCSSEVCMLENLKVLLEGKVVVDKRSFEVLRRKAAKLDEMEVKVREMKALASSLREEVEISDRE